ncbi:DUF1707 domain-containing protein [Jiangella anatolica]|uniref:DUF1707 domain-containing protein n=1 Tax=Jiangella anatolica TaxID=2670374 RepID=A0A2W2BSX6_9ACTN|nr:DUF1707 domain-containing protein [Jiangella anatolica]PZF83554.1 hypothetical protein C1I92_12340 [Jiangella anatolica]
MSDLPARRPEQRASDADREIVAEDLRDAFGEGRLDNDEYERRIQAVWESRTYGELDRLTADLPQPRQRERLQEEQKAVEARKKRELREYLDEWQAWVGGAVIMIGIWGISSLTAGELRNFWPVWPLGIWGLILLVSAFGGGKDDKKKDG